MAVRNQRQQSHFVSTPFALTVHHGPYLVVVGSGHAQLCDLLGLFDFAASLSGSCQYQRALVDLYGVEIGFSFTDHLSLGMHAAQALRRLDRVASVVHPRYRVGTSERAAQKAGLQLRTFIDRLAATEWLLQAG